MRRRAEPIFRRRTLHQSDRPARRCDALVPSLEIRFQCRRGNCTRALSFRTIRLPSPSHSVRCVTVLIHAATVQFLLPFSILGTTRGASPHPSIYPDSFARSPSPWPGAEVALHTRRADANATFMWTAFGGLPIPPHLMAISLRGRARRQGTTPWVHGASSPTVPP
jgi:hypothetical protein